MPLLYGRLLHPIMRNAALGTATGCTQDTNIQHLHNEKHSHSPIHEHLQLHASQYKQKTQLPSYPLHKHTTYFNTPRLKKTIFLTTAATQQTSHRPPHSHYNRHKTNMRHIHGAQSTELVSLYIGYWTLNNYYYYYYYTYIYCL